MLTRNIVVIGGSAGGLAPLKTIVRSMPAAFPGSIFVVIHTSPESPGVLPSILSRAGSLPAEYAVNGEPVRPRRIYVAPPDHHLLLDRGRIRVTRGPRENSFRPAVDPLFRTAASAYGPAVIGIILSGAQDDGVAGLAQIKQRGGIAIAQDPREAEAPSMPASAARHVAVDHVLRAADMAVVISGLAGAPVEEETVSTDDKEPRGNGDEGLAALRTGSLPGPPSSFTCPECGGALWELRERELVRFQCHVGHRFNGESLLAAHSDGLESALWAALRALEEHAALRRRMARHARDRGMTAIAESYEAHALESEKRADIVRRLLVDDRRSSPQAVPSAKG